MRNWLTYCAKTKDIVLWLFLLIVILVVGWGDTRLGWKLAPSSGAILVCVGVLLQYRSAERANGIMIQLQTMTINMIRIAKTGSREEGEGELEKVENIRSSAKYETITSRLSVCLVIIGSLIWAFGDKLLGYI